MFKTTALDSVANAFVDKNDLTSTPGTRTEADDRNINQDEMVNIVERSGQTLDATGVIRDQLAQAFVLNQASRSAFAYVAATQLSIAGGAYFHYGTLNQVLKIDSTITHTITSPGTSQWQYIYADDSAIVAAATNILTGTEIINSTTAPTYSVTKKGWYNGDDLCIFAVYIDSGGDILEFFHDGDFVLYADEITIIADVDIDTGWTDQILIIPGFSTSGLCRFKAEYVDGASSLSWRTNGQTGTDGHLIGSVGSTILNQRVVSRVITDSSQTIEIIMSASNGNVASLAVHGWYLPLGM